MDKIDQLLDQLVAKIDRLWKWFKTPVGLIVFGTMIFIIGFTIHSTRDTNLLSSHLVLRSYYCMFIGIFLVLFGFVWRVGGFKKKK